MSGTQTYTIQENTTLLPFLLKTFPHSGRNKIKSFLKYKSVSVNGKVTRRHDQPLIQGDRVAIQTDTKPVSKKEFLKSKLDIVYEDEWIIVINKPSGLLTVATETVKNETAIHHLNDYLNGGSARKQKMIFVVHRLDQGASGVLIFAKDHDVKHKLQDNWDKVEKRYYAIVEGKPPEDSGTVISYLQENSRMKVYSTTRGGAKHSVTRYKLLKTSGNYSLLEIILQTGRKHQIRVHLSDIGCPIIGDDRYRSKSNPAGRLGLHAFYLSLPHPVTGQKMEFKTELPKTLKRVIEKTGD